MKAKVLDLEGKKVKDIDLPKQFNEEYRPDLIKRAFLAIMSHKRQPYGAFEEAGKRYSSKLSKRRGKYRGSYGKGISRVPRKILTRRGTQFYWVGATIPGTVGGRRAHPPKAEKDFGQKMNIKERRKAIRSAISATVVKEIVGKRGHKFGEEFPIVVESKFESLDKTKDVKKVLEKIGLKDEIVRVDERKIRAGRGKMRGRKYKMKKGPLIVVSGECKLMNSSDNIPGVDVADVRYLNVELLAPGSDAGRLCIWSDKSIELMEKEGLFLEKKK